MAGPATSPVWMSLAEQAVRLMRTRWYDPQLLAEELFTIFSTIHAPPNLGPITVDFGDGRPPATLRPESVRDPSGGFRFPDLEFPELNLQSYGNPDRDNLGHLVNVNNINFTEIIQNPDAGPEGQSQPTQKVRQRVEVIRHRTVVPGKIVSGSGRTYTMKLFPNGEDEDGFNVTGVKHMDVDTAEVFPVDMWFLVWRYLETQVTTTTYLQSIPGNQIDVEVSRKVDIQLTKTKHRILGEVWP